MKYIHPPATSRKAGLSLVELLVAMGIFLTLLAAITISWIRTSDLVGGMVTESDLVEDARNASAIIADGLARAVYIYPPGSDIKLNTDPGKLLRNPVDNSNNFRVENYAGAKAENIDGITTVSSLTSNTKRPIIAFLEAEKKLGEPCNSVPSDGCLTFVAYYLAKRSSLTAAGETFDFLGDPSNGTKWMLLEYRRQVLRTTGNLGTQGIPKNPQNGQAKLLLDYVDPEYLYIYFSQCGTGNAAKPLDDCATTVTLTGVDETKKTAVSGRIRFRSGVSQRNKTRQYFTPEMSFAIAPRNLVNNLLQ